MLTSSTGQRHSQVSTRGACAPIARPALLLSSGAREEPPAASAHADEHAPLRYAESDSESESDGDSDSVEEPAFPKLSVEIDAAIAALGGAVLPKLNWSAPKDAVWLSPTGSAKCTNAEEVLLLLKASDSIAHDVCDAYHCCIDNDRGAERPEGADGPHGGDMFLTLRRWHELRPAMLFRCFVRSRRLVGACQRDPSQFFPFLRDERSRLVHAIGAFVRERIAPRFEREHVVVDVYVQQSGDQMKVHLVDFNPAGGSTLPLMFEWEELGYDCSEGGGVAGGQSGGEAGGAGGEDCAGHDDDGGAFELRIVEEEQMVRPGLRLGVPLDMIDTSAGGAIDQAMKNFELQRRQRQEERQ